MKILCSVLTFAVALNLAVPSLAQAVNDKAIKDALYDLGVRPATTNYYLEAFRSDFEGKGMRDYLKGELSRLYGSSTLTARQIEVYEMEIDKMAVLVMTYSAEEIENDSEVSLVTKTRIRKVETESAKRIVEFVKAHSVPTEFTEGNFDDIRVFQYTLKSLTCSNAVTSGYEVKCAVEK